MNWHSPMIQHTTKQELRKYCVNWWISWNGYFSILFVKYFFHWPCITFTSRWTDTAQLYHKSRSRRRHQSFATILRLARWPLTLPSFQTYTGETSSECQWVYLSMFYETQMGQLSNSLVLPVWICYLRFLQSKTKTTQFKSHIYVCWTVVMVVHLSVETDGSRLRKGMMTAQGTSLAHSALPSDNLKSENCAMK